LPAFAVIVSCSNSRFFALSVMSPGRRVALDDVAVPTMPTSTTAAATAAMAREGVFAASVPFLWRSVATAATMPEIGRRTVAVAHDISNHDCG
jgi:hypothetical protein